MQKATQVGSFVDNVVLRRTGSYKLKTNKQREREREKRGKVCERE